MPILLENSAYKLNPDDLFGNKIADIDYDAKDAILKGLNDKDNDICRIKIRNYIAQVLHVRSDSLKLYKDSLFKYLLYIIDKNIVNRNQIKSVLKMFVIKINDKKLILI